MNRLERRLEIIVIGILLTLGVVYGAINVVKVMPMHYKVQATNVGIGTTAVALPTTAMVGRESIAITNLSASTLTVYIGQSGIGTSNGFPLNSSTPSVSLDLDDSVAVYGIGTTAGPADVRILEAK